MNRIQKILERRRKEFAPPFIACRTLPRELPKPVSAINSDTERIQKK